MLEAITKKTLFYSYPEENARFEVISCIRNDDVRISVVLQFRYKSLSPCEVSLSAELDPACV